MLKNIFFGNNNTVLENITDVEVPIIENKAEIEIKPVMRGCQARESRSLQRDC